MREIATTPHVPTKILCRVVQLEAASGVPRSHPEGRSERGDDGRWETRGVGNCRNPAGPCQAGDAAEVRTRFETRSVRILSHPLTMGFVVDLIIVLVALAVSLLVTVPIVGGLVRLRANYNPKGLQLDEEGVVHPYTGPQLTSFFGMLARVKRLEVRPR